MSRAGADTLKGHRSISDVTFDLDGELSTEIGWVVFEVNDEQPERCCGVIGTFNNYATLRLIRFARSQRPCRIQGFFDDGKQTRTHMLDDIAFAEILVLDVSGFVGFSASIIA
jgi:hypothetical protein